MPPRRSIKCRRCALPSTEGRRRSQPGRRLVSQPYGISSNRLYTTPLVIAAIRAESKPPRDHERQSERSTAWAANRRDDPVVLRASTCQGLKTAVSDPLGIPSIKCRSNECTKPLELCLQDPCRILGPRASGRLVAGLNNGWCNGRAKPIIIIWIAPHQPQRSFRGRQSVRGRRWGHGLSMVIPCRPRSPPGHFDLVDPSIQSNGCAHTTQSLEAR